MKVDVLIGRNSRGYYVGHSGNILLEHATYVSGDLNL
jgi:hypothetical protein